MIRSIRLKSTKLLTKWVDQKFIGDFDLELLYFIQPFRWSPDREFLPIFCRYKRIHLSSLTLTIPLLMELISVIVFEYCQLQLLFLRLVSERSPATRSGRFLLQMNLRRPILRQSSHQKSVLLKSFGPFLCGWNNMKHFFSKFRTWKWNKNLTWRSLLWRSRI